MREKRWKEWWRGKEPTTKRKEKKERLLRDDRRKIRKKKKTPRGEKSAGKKGKIQSRVERGRRKSAFWNASPIPVKPRDARRLPSKMEEGKDSRKKRGGFRTYRNIKRNTRKGMNGRKKQ